MTEARKIITVSCGALSCRIEGFDDPMAMAREIAAFFHSLTSAETAAARPPEALHRVAQTSAAEATVPEEAPAEMMSFDAAALAPVPAAQGAATEAPAESVAAKLSRIRAAMARRGDPAMTEDQHAEDVFAAPDRPAAASAAASVPADAIAPPQDVPPQDAAAEAAPSGTDGARDAGAAQPPVAAVSREEEPSYLRAEVVRLRRSAHDGAETAGPAAEEDRLRRGDAPSLEQDLARLLSTAESRLSLQDNRRRSSTIAHLKAAVAATTAERALSPAGARAPAEAEKAREMARYREDLSQAVRPPQILSGAARPAPAVALRQAPLVLVSEQRIDLPGALSPAPFSSPAAVMEVEAAGEAPLQPADDTPEPAKPRSGGAAWSPSFAEFAGTLGASALDDLLEAAAAHSVAIEGRPHFSRPQIMRKAASVAEGRDCTRQARLRAFGALLRQGRIVRLEAGQFAIAEASPYYAAARSAGASRQVRH